MKKKYISLFLVLMMILSTVSVFAEVEGETPDQGTGNDIEATTPEADAQAPAEVTEGEEATQEEGVVPESEGVVEEPQEEGVLREMTAGASLNVTATPSATSATVTWELVNGEGVTVTNYNVKADGVAEEYNGMETSHSFNNLSPGKYTFKVIATVQDGDPIEGTAAEIEIKGEEPSPVTLTTYSSYKGVALEWTKDSKAVTYDIYRDGAWIGGGPASAFNSAYDNGSLLSFIDTGAGDEKNHNYYVKSTLGSNSVNSNTCQDQMVMPFYIKIQFRETKTLKPHGGKKVSHKFRKGDVVYATGFVKGQYHFMYNGTLYYVNYNRTTKQVAKYNGKKGFNYNKKEVEYFINNSGQTSMTNYMIYVNLYTQHLYILTGQANTKGNWRVTSINYKGKNYQDWEISSGTAKTPSPWGLNLKYKRKLVNKYKKLKVNPGHGSKYWNFYHSQSALHGRADGKGYGVPHSHGCIRSTDPQGIFLFNKIPMKTRIAIY